MTSISVEDYLKTIYLLQQAAREERRVKNKEIADALDIALSSVTNMVKSLANQGTLDYAPYQGVRLTQAGERAALRVIRKHRLIEVFLIEQLEMSWDEVHEEAERLEHAVSDKLADRLEAYLGSPTHDPHGDPIPDREGRMPESRGRPLAVVSPPARVEIVRVMDQSAEFLRYLDDQGLRPGRILEFRAAEPFDGPLHLVTAGKDLHLSRSQARRIWVQERAEGEGGGGSDDEERPTSGD